MIQLLSIFVNVLAPVFSLVLVGYLAGPRLDIDARSLSKVAYYILAPAFVFNIFSDASIQGYLALRMAAFIIAVTTGCVLVALLAACLMGRPGPIVAAFVLVSAFGNAANFGLPIIQFKFGEEALVPASVYFLVLNVYGFVVGVTAAAWNRGGALDAIRSVVKTPAILAVIPAISVNWLNLEIPLFLERGVGLLAVALIPLMLLTLGMQLATMGRPHLNASVTVASMVRLVVGPALAFALAAVFGLTGIERGAGILQASMPSAVFAVLIALEYALVPSFVTTTVLVSTLASALTLTIVLALI